MTGTPKAFPQHHDDEFIRWCGNHPNGFVGNAIVPRKPIGPGSDFMLHGALPKGELCRSFRSQNGPNGYRPNLTTTYRKVCDLTLHVLEKWAGGENRIKQCDYCSRAGCFL
jgi:hypothetical protein